ncbi:MAG: protein O-mannosyl-transferase family [Anaerolineae bacterium]
MTWRRVAATVIVVGVALTVYGMTMAPTLSWSHWGADGGDLVTAAVTGRLSHPPGFPLYLGFADLFVRLPWSNPAWRLNLLSAVMGAGAVAAVAAAILVLNDSAVAGSVGGIALVVAPLFWSQALITEVYTTAALFSALFLFWWVGIRRSASRRSIVLGGILWGLGLTVHPTLIFLAPLWLDLGWEGWPGLLAALGIAGIAYVFLQLRGPWPQPWGDLGNFDGWWEYVSARLYWGYAFSVPLGDWPRRALSWVTTLVRQFTPLGALLCIWGVSYLWQERPRRTVGLLLTFAGISAYAIGYDTSDSLIYMVPFLSIPALWLGAGIEAAAARGVPRLLWLLIPVASLIWHVGAMDLSGDLAAQQWWERTLVQTPAEAVLVTSQDAHTFTLWYVQEVLHLRPDVVVVDEDLWGDEAYRDYITQEIQRPVTPLTLEGLAEGYPLCYVGASTVECR